MTPTTKLIQVHYENVLCYVLCILLRRTIYWGIWMVFHIYRPLLTQNRHVSRSACRCSLSSPNCCVGMASVTQGTHTGRGWNSTLCWLGSSGCLYTCTGFGWNPTFCCVGRICMCTGTGWNPTLGCLGRCCWICICTGTAHRNMSAHS